MVIETLAHITWFGQVSDSGLSLSKSHTLNQQSPLMLKYYLILNCVFILYSVS